jgi:hypothetical protein
VCNPAEHGETVILGQSECLRHPWEVVRETEVTAADSFWHTFTSTRETQRRGTVGTDNNFRGMRFELELVFEDILLAVTA